MSQHITYMDAAIITYEYIGELCLVIIITVDIIHAYIYGEETRHSSDCSTQTVPVLVSGGSKMPNTFVMISEYSYGHACDL